MHDVAIMSKAEFPLRVGMVIVSESTHGFFRRVGHTMDGAQSSGSVGA